MRTKRVIQTQQPESAAAVRMGCMSSTTTFSRKVRLWSSESWRCRESAAAGVSSTDDETSEHVRVVAGTDVVAPLTECTSVDAIDSHRMCETVRNPLSPISARSGRSMNSSAPARASAVGSTTSR